MGETKVKRLFSSLKSIFFTHYASFRGRAGRGELLLGLFTEILIFAVWISLKSLLGNALSEADGFWITWALILFLTPPALSVQVRRLHDVNWNGFWLWLTPVPIAQVFLWVVLFLRKGTDGPNRYDDPQPPRPLYRNPVCWGVGVLVCWMILPQLLWKIPERITPETHFITEPRTSDGMVDYYTAMMDQYKEMFADPEKNGMWDLLQMFGTKIFSFQSSSGEGYTQDAAFLTLERLGLPRDIQPEFPDFELLSTDWIWDRLPELPDGLPDISSLKIDPEDYLREEGEWRPFEYLSPDDKLYFYFYFYLFRPWREADHPLAAEWLKENDAILDRIAAAVRKPYFMDWPSRREMNRLNEIINWLNWMENFVNVFQIRASYHAGSGEIDKALDDAQTVLLLALHVKKGSIFQYVYDGQRFESNGISTVARIVKSQDISPQELEKAAAILNDFQQANRVPFRQTMERLRYEVFMHLGERMLIRYYDFDDYFLNERTIRRTFQKIWFEDVENQCSGEKPIPRDSYSWSEMEERSQKYASPWNEPWRLLTGTFFRDWRSRNCAASIAMNKTYYYELLERDFVNRACVNLLRASVELELYKVRNGAYPAKLAELKLPEEVLLDPYSPTRESLKYSLKSQDEQSPQYLLYSLGPNLKDDGGNNDEDWGLGLN